MPSIEIYDEINEALTERIEWEKKVARNALQRYCMDRQKVNNHPWPRASNVRFPLSDTLINQFLPFLFKVLYSSERIAYFKSQSATNVQFAGIVSDYFDFIIKEKTDLERIIQYSTNRYLQDGETILKVIWDEDCKVPVFESIDNLNIITPSTTLDMQDSPWVVHVLQMSKKKALERFRDVPGIEGFIKKVEDGQSYANDKVQKQFDEYSREGINVSGKNGNLVFWERHYRGKNGIERIETMSPDDPDFDFKDDHEYLYPMGKTNREGKYFDGRFMFEHTKWEYADEKMHSARGIPEIVIEGEYTLTALERAKQNAMTLYNTPMMFATGNAPPGNTQNITWTPGSFLPFPISVTNMGEPPISWDMEMNRTREIWERRIGSPDYGIGSARTGKDSKTATEVNALQNQQGLNVDLIAGNWKIFLRSVFKQAWSLIVKARPESLDFFVNSQQMQVPEEALNNDYAITLAGSAETINREVMTQKAITLWQMSQNNPFANVGEAWKDLLQNLKPGEVDRFYQDPAERQQLQVKKTASDISVIITTGYPMVPDPSDDLTVAAQSAMQFLQAAGSRGQQLSPDQVNKISQYIAAARDGLKKQNPQAYAQLNQQLNQMDLQNKQAQMMQAQAPTNAVSPEVVNRLNGALPS